MSTALVLAGCAQAAPEPVRSSSAVPTSTTSAAASLSLAAAMAFYSSYLTADNRVLQSGGRGYESLRPFLADDPYRAAVKNLKQLAASHERVKGGAVLSNSRLQRRTPRGLVAYVCLDISKARLLDENGNDITPAGRPDRQTLIVTFAGGAVPKIEASQSWGGSSIC